MWSWEYPRPFVTTLTRHHYPHYQHRPSSKFLLQLQFGHLMPLTHCCAAYCACPKFETGAQLFVGQWLSFLHKGLWSDIVAKQRLTCIHLCHCIVLTFTFFYLFLNGYIQVCIYCSFFLSIHLRTINWLVIFIKNKCLVWNSLESMLCHDSVLLLVFCADWLLASTPIFQSRVRDNSE